MKMINRYTEYQIVNSNYMYFDKKSEEMMMRGKLGDAMVANDLAYQSLFNLYLIDTDNRDSKIRLLKELQEKGEKIVLHPKFRRRLSR